MVDESGRSLTVFIVDSCYLLTWYRLSLVHLTEPRFVESEMQQPNYWRIGDATAVSSYLKHLLFDVIQSNYCYEVVYRIDNAGVNDTPWSPQFVAFRCGYCWWKSDLTSVYHIVSIHFVRYLTLCISSSQMSPDSFFLRYSSDNT
jgi:hypothetical protein